MSFKAIATTLYFLLATVTFTSQLPTIFRSTYKGLRGLMPLTNAVESGETRVVYYHEQTVAIVDLSSNNELHYCNLVEVYEPEEVEEVLRNLSTVASPQWVSFKDMMVLIKQCDLMDKLRAKFLLQLYSSPQAKQNSAVMNSLALLSGIVPGTKWCGTGDIADNYNDLGQEASIDRCCRSHDLCPVKVRAQKSRYNLTNYSLYTKSHCACDEFFYQCLKAAKHTTANILGNLYFNIIKVPCIEDKPNIRHMNTTKQFVAVKMRY